MRFSFFLFVCVLAIHCYFLSPTFIDVPYRDSWQLIGDEFAENFPLSWFFRFHNEHVIFSLKFQILLLYLLSAWNVELHLWCNLFIYFGFLALLSTIIRPVLKENHLFFLPLLFIPLICDLNWENLSWEFQSCFHWYLLFTIVAVKYVKPKPILATFSSVLAVCSFSAGIATSLVLWVYFIFSSKNLWQFFWASILLLFPLSLYYFFANSYPSTLAYPSTFAFWNCFFNLLSFGFGYETFSFQLGLLCFAFVLIPLIFAFSRVKKGELEYVNLLILAFSILLALAFISLGRANRPDLHIWSKGARYFEISSILFPLSLSIWIEIFDRLLIQLKRPVIFLCLLIFALGYFDNFRFSQYEWIAKQKQTGLKCVKDYLAANEGIKSGQAPAVYCPELWAEEASRKIYLAKELKLSFLSK